MEFDFKTQNLLGIRNKPDPFADWDNLYNCKNQSNIRKDCRELMKKIQPTEWTVPELESLLTLYCKRRNVDYDTKGGWLEMLGKLLLLPFDQCNMFNIFWAITTKYIPRFRRFLTNLNILQLFKNL